MSKVPGPTTPPAPRFMEGVVSHLEAYAKSAGLKPEDVHVRLLLADGASHLVVGLKVSGPLPPSSLGWGMIEGVISDVGGATSALVVRESHIVKVQFASEPDRPNRIGL